LPDQKALNWQDEEVNDYRDVLMYGIDQITKKHPNIYYIN